MQPTKLPIEMNSSSSARKSRLFKFAASGAIFLVLSYTVLVMNPLKMIVDRKLTMFSGSFIYNLWEKPPLDVYISVYLFNITNADAFMAGTDKKLKVADVGPYVYQEFLQNENVTFNANGTISFRPIRTRKFILERSVGDPNNDTIIVPNVPLLGVSTAAAKMSMFAALGLSTITKSLGSQPILKMKVQDFLWGYDDPLIKLASKVVPTINFEKFGVLDRMFDDGENVVTMNLPSSEGKKRYLAKQKLIQEAEELRDSHKTLYDSGIFDFSFSKEAERADTYEPEIRDFSIDTWNGSPGLKHWGYTSNRNSQCNTLQGAYDGTLFPRNITQNEVFYIYRKTFCRTLPIQFSHAGRILGYDGYWFKLAKDAFDSFNDDSKTSCYCEDRQCLKKGLGNITPCYYNIPVAVSLPHFYGSDPSLLKEVEGLSPDAEKHDFVVVIQPDIGVPIKVNSRVQLNLLVGESRFNSDIKPFDHTVIPIMWAEIAIDKLTPDLDFLLNLLFNVAPYLQIGIIVFLAMIGLSLFAVSIITYWFIPQTPLEVYPKDNIRYSAINMLPYIKKGLEMYGEKIDDESHVELI